MPAGSMSQAATRSSHRGSPGLICRLRRPARWEVQMVSSAACCWCTVGQTLRLGSPCCAGGRLRRGWPLRASEPFVWPMRGADFSGQSPGEPLEEGCTVARAGAESFRPLRRHTRPAWHLVCMCGFRRSKLSARLQRVPRLATSVAGAAALLEHDGHFPARLKASGRACCDRGMLYVHLQGSRGHDGDFTRSVPDFGASPPSSTRTAGRSAGCSARDHVRSPTFSRSCMPLPGLLQVRRARALALALKARPTSARSAVGKLRRPGVVRGPPAVQRSGPSRSRCSIGRWPACRMPKGKRRLVLCCRCLVSRCARPFTAGNSQFPRQACARQVLSR
jgi:hypothetical protein